MKRQVRKKTVHRADDPAYPRSGHGLMHVCPHCGEALALRDLRDGDQAYWCERCQKGHRASDPPPQAFLPLKTGS